MKEVPQSIHEKVFVQFYPYKYKKWIKRYAKGIDPYLIAALIRQESGFLPGIRSPAGAVGLMQLLPSTARMMKRRVNRWSLKRPALNIRLGTKYLKRLVKRYDGETELALAAYNAGPQNVDQWLRRYPVHNRMLFLDLIPFAETRNYVVLIGRNYHWYRRLYSTRTPATQKVSAKFEALESFLQ
ncbi:MAG: lytic transglycosylase [Bdellovibrionaceae bacterium]|nr:lytic transglycosylase [Pseudobdellovibrionaceae bacterium]